MFVPLASSSGLPTHVAEVPKPAWLHKEWPLRVRVLVVLALYGSYFLLGGGLTGERMPYDAGHYWELAVTLKNPATGFSMLNFQDPTRGYCAALLQLPALIVRFLTHCSMPVAAKATGLGWAALLYAGLLPALWRSVVPGRVAGGRWLLLLLLGFAFWRDHFSFSLTDVPALALLLLTLWAFSRAALGWWLVAGLSLAAAFNSRPAYVAAVPRWPWPFGGTRSMTADMARVVGGCCYWGWPWCWRRSGASTSVISGKTRPSCWPA